MSYDEANSLLCKSGASLHDARALSSTLPPHFNGNALFLLRALEQVRLGVPLPDEQTPAAWVKAFAQHFISDIATRLRANGRGLGEGTIGESLEAIALAILDSPDRIAKREQLRQIPDADHEGEQTFLERAVQAGLLVRQNAGISFAHALFFEHFAASALSREPNLARCLERLSGESDHEVLTQVVMLRESPIDLLLQLTRTHPVAACKVAARLDRIDDAGLRQSLVDAAGTQLDGRFLSDKVRALRLLRGLKSPEARRRAVTWFNALPPSSKTLLKHEAAELFLTLEEPAAFRVILFHVELMPDWYEPRLVARFERLSRPFAETLKAEARKHLSTNDASCSWARPRVIMLLALLRDDWLQAHLEQKLQQGPLNDVENRALLHLNTDEAITTYAASVERHWELEDEAASSNTDKSRDASLADDAYMLRGADIFMNEHGTLTELTAIALTGNEARRVLFAADWAVFLAEEQLVRPYYSACRRFSGSLLRTRSDLISNIIERTGAERALKMYRESEDDDLRGDIVAALYRAPSPESIAFLRARLKERRHHFSATQSLRLMGAIGAAPDIQELLKTGEPHVQAMAAQTLGTLRHVPAVSDLVQGMNAGIYGCIAALGHIGTIDAYKALGRHFRAAVGEREQMAILRALVQLRDAIGLDIACNLCDEFAEARAGIACALGYPDLGERPDEWDDIGPLLFDRRLLDHALSSARDALRSAPALLDFSLRGIAAFDAAEALEFLCDVAESRLPPDAYAGEKRSKERRHEAARLLALRGIERYQRRVVEEELDKVRDETPSWAFHQLRTWPQQVVRNALVARVAVGSRLRTWVELLQWFAAPGDYELFRGLEEHDDEVVADIAHECCQRLDATRRRIQ